VRRLTAPSRFRLREKASIFLAEVHSAADAAARAGLLAALRKRDHDATHHCSAWREGLPLRAEGSDDDGEPGGTAGAPMLRVLQGAEATDLLAVVIRWYGGTKLGTGGLVRAYTEALQGALAEADAQGLWQELRPMAHGRLVAPPSMAHLAFQVLGAFPDAKVRDQGFDAAGAWVAFALPPGQEVDLEKAWQERSRGGSVAWQGVFADA
jgi:putative IMPACT (imprinted ancient) family translation regulator